MGLQALSVGRLLAALDAGVAGFHEFRESESDVVGVLARGCRQPVQGGESLCRCTQIVDQVVDEGVEERAGAQGPADPVEALGEFGVQGQ
ncbi:hypothetical protein BX286_7059 [Streptomyces sp. 3211.6]|nr:hypothetical protein BX286_7059 [Streptomyces sp. 3211.6]RPF25587.1 hypothetical protein EDD96_7111 [Streptomyces sp. Ag109_G2-6]